MQVQAPNRPELLWSRAMVVSVVGKGAARPRQVRIMKTNASEPPMTCRKRRNDVETGAESLTRDKSRRNLSTAWTASGMKVA
jgi:hypothetical protein